MILFSAIDLTSVISKVLTPLKISLVSWAGSSVQPLLAIAGAFLVFWLVRLVLIEVKSYATMACGGHDGFSGDDFEEGVDIDEDELVETEDGYIYDGLLFNDIGDVNDYISIRDDPDF